MAILVPEAAARWHWRRLGGSQWGFLARSGFIQDSFRILWEGWRAPWGVGGVGGREGGGGEEGERGFSVTNGPSAFDDDPKDRIVSNQ